MSTTSLGGSASQRGSKRSTIPSGAGRREAPPIAYNHPLTMAAAIPKRGVASDGPIHQRVPSKTCTSSPTVQMPLWKDTAAKSEAGFGSGGRVDQRSATGS